MNENSDKTVPEARYFLVYDERSAAILRHYSPIIEECKKRVAIIEATELLEKKKDAPGSGDRVLVCGKTVTLKKIVQDSTEKKYSIAILPMDSQHYLYKSYSIPRDPAKIFDIFFNSEAKALDLLYAGGDMPVLYSATIGDVPLHDVCSSIEAGTAEIAQKLKQFFSMTCKIRKLKLFTAELETAKNFRIKTALSGMVVFSEGGATCVSALMKERSYNDGQMRAVLISPRSVISYLHYIAVVLFPAFGRGDTLLSTGFIKSKGLSVRSGSGEPLRLSIDGEELEPVNEISFSIKEKCVLFCMSENFWERNAAQKSEKETLRLEHMPQTEESVAYERKGIPLFAHASEQEYRELFAALRSEGRFDNSFALMMILSTLLAATGLFLNSSSVVIGAMLLAPLMQPIVSFSMGVLRWDIAMLNSAVKTILSGIILVLLSSSLLSVLMPFREITDEMAGRIHPSLLDLIVAVISGMAAAYAKNNSRISGSLVGVSVAVALVPPLATAGIGIGWGSWSMFYNAFLLFMTNFAGITAASGIVFVFAGYSPVHRAKKGLGFGLLMVFLVSIPLYLSFMRLVEDAGVLKSLENRSIQLNGIMVKLENVDIVHAPGYGIKCEIVTPRHIKQNEFISLKRSIGEGLPSKVSFIEMVERVHIPIGPK